MPGIAELSPNEIASELQSTGAWKRIPEQAERIAERYSRKLQTPGLKSPLQELLVDAATVEGLRALALMAWEDTAAPLNLSVYGVIDRLSVAQPDAASRQTARSLRQLHHRFARSLDSCSVGMGTGLSFINARGEDMAVVVASFLREITGDTCLVRRDAEPSFFTVAVVDERR